MTKRTLSTVAALSLACACTTGEPELDLTSHRAGLGAAGGPIPVPVKGEEPSWDGTYADLLAADVLASCWASQPETFTTDVLRSDAERDFLLSYLGSHMTKSTSVQPEGADADDLYDAWIASRGNDQFNVSLEDGKESSLALDTAVRPNPHFTLPTELASSLQGPRVAAAIQEAQWFLAYTDLSLCMAFRLREHLDSATVVFAADREVRRLTDLVHERALTAVVQFSLLVKVLHGDEETAPESIDSRHQWLGVLRKWADIATPQT